MNLYESIATKLNEAYVAKVSDDKLKSSIEGFFNMLESATAKYITKDVIQAVYKVTANALKTGENKEEVDKFMSDADLIPAEIERIKLSPECTAILYSPIVISDTGRLEVTSNTALSVNYGFDEISGVPSSALPKEDIIILTDDGCINYEITLNGLSGYERDIFIEKSLTLLDNKTRLAQIYKQHCKSISETFLKLANEMSVTREQTIADEQRNLENRLKGV